MDNNSVDDAMVFQAQDEDEENQCLVAKRPTDSFWRGKHGEARPTQFRRTIDRPPLMTLIVLSLILLFTIVANVVWHKIDDKAVSSEVPVLSLNDQRHSRLEKGPQISECDCGHSVAEAKTMNCTFDALAMAWLPPYCLDHELSDEFAHAASGADGQWTYYADKAGTRKMNVAEVSLLADTGEPFYATEEWHVSHCIFSWKKQLRAIETGVMIEDRYYRVEHVEHCGMVMMDALKVEPGAIAVEAKVLLNSRLRDDDVGVLKSRYTSRY